MTIREEAREFGKELGEAIGKCVDDVPNREEFGSIMKEFYDAINAGTDIFQAPKEDRARAFVLGTVHAVPIIVENTVEFSDEV